MYINYIDFLESFQWILIHQDGGGGGGARTFILILLQCTWYTIRAIILNKTMINLNRFEVLVR